MHPIASLFFEVLFVFCVALALDDTDSNWDKIVAALRGDRMR